MLFKFTEKEEQLARGATFLDDMDLIHSPNGGHLVPVAVKYGVHVCWCCGEPFDPSSSTLRLVEKRIDGGSVPIGVHAKCVKPKVMSRPFFDVVNGLGVRRGLAEAVRKTASILEGV